MRSVVAHIVSCILLAGISLMTSCREDEVIILAEYERSETTAGLIMPDFIC